MLGIVTFIMIPSAVFYHIESDWTYLDSLYYSFTSLATIGFGDLTNSHNIAVEEKLGKWMYAYKAFTMLWLIFGLGFVSWINTIIADKIWRRRSHRRKSKVNLRRFSLTPMIMTRLPVIDEEVFDTEHVTTQTMISDHQQHDPCGLPEGDGVSDTETVMKQSKSPLIRRRTCSDLTM